MNGVDPETLARAALTFCLDGADALMFATIKGAGSAQKVLQLVIDSRPHAPAPMASLTRRELDDVFARGITRWGRRITRRGMEAFHVSLDGWHRRLNLLPTLDIASLAGWFTEDGAQWIIAPHSPFWPAQLADLSIRKDWAAPLCLWGLGDPAALVSCPQPVAVVGSRGANDYGRSVARSIGEQAAGGGHLVVSGGAMGADAAAHWGALSAVSSGYDPAAVGRTVAVFAGGLNHIGPHCNRMLFERITAGGGALISELCPDTIPEGRRFLLRNRIIAAMASTVVVTQARLRSGALNTANWAAELGREIYAVPGSIDEPDHAGCNRIIHDHQAILLTSATAIDDICHAPHAPVTPADPAAPAGGNASAPATSRREEAPESSAATPETPAATGTTAAPRDALTADQRRIHTAIRRCRRLRIAPTAEAIAAHQDGGSDGTDHSAAPDAGDPMLAKVITLLGEMELDGLVTISGGVAAIARPGET